MAQVALADSLQLPPDSTGKRTGMAKVNIGGTDVYLPASVLTDASGNIIDSATAAPAGTERGLITRNVPSGTQTVSGTVTANAGTGPFPVSDNAGSLTVDAPVGTPVFVRLSDGTSAIATLPVSLSSLPAVTLAAGAATVGTVLNVGDVDHDAVNTGKVVQTGGHASPQNTPPAAVSAAGDRVRTWQDMNGAQIIRPRKSPTYWAVFRAAARPYNLDKTFTANTRVQFATIHHAATATKTVRLRRVKVTIHALITSAAELNLDLVRITAAPATGNPAITPGVAENSDAAAEATCLALPTTAGTEGAVIASRYMSYGVTGAASVVNPPPIFASYELVEPGLGDDESKLPTIRSGVLEGWAVTIDATAAVRLLARVEIQFTEE